MKKISNEQIWTSVKLVQSTMTIVCYSWYKKIYLYLIFFFLMKENRKGKLETKETSYLWEWWEEWKGGGNRIGMASLRRTFS